MKTTPKGIENLTDDERRVTRIDEAKEIPEFPGYFLTPVGWVWDEENERFLTPKWRTRIKKSRFLAGGEYYVTTRTGAVYTAMSYAQYPISKYRRPRTICVHRRLDKMFWKRPLV